MSDRLDEALKQRYVYLERGREKDTLGPGKQLGLALAQRHRARLTVLSVQKGGATHHPELAKQTIVTERSGRIEDGRSRPRPVPAPQDVGEAAPLGE